MNSDDRPTRIVLDLDLCKNAAEENRICEALTKKEPVVYSLGALSADI